MQEVFDRLLESVTDQRLAQLKALLKGIKVGTVFGFSFLNVSEAIRVPIKVSALDLACPCFCCVFGTNHLKSAGLS